jgi:hypothetical protein
LILNSTKGLSVAEGKNYPLPKSIFQKCQKIYVKLLKIQGQIGQNLKLFETIPQDLEALIRNLCVPFLNIVIKRKIRTKLKGIIEFSLNERAEEQKNPLPIASPRKWRINLNQNTRNSTTIRLDSSGFSYQLPQQ